MLYSEVRVSTRALLFLIEVSGLCTCSLSRLSLVWGRRELRKTYLLIISAVGAEEHVGNCKDIRNLSIWSECRIFVVSHGTYQD